MIINNSFRLIGWYINCFIIALCVLIVIRLANNDIADAGRYGLSLSILLMWSVERHDLRKGKRKNDES